MTDSRPNRSTGLSRDAATIFILALAPAAGVGIARFAYSLLLPDMRASLGWSYTAAGFMNTVNALGYLVGAAMAAAAVRRFGQFNAVFYGTLGCVAALGVSAATGNFAVLSLARLAAGVGAAIAFVGGGVATAHLAQRHPGRTTFLLSLYYIGPGLGILVSGIGTPLVLEWLGPGSWWIAWGMLAMVTAVFALALLAARDAAARGAGNVTQSKAPLAPMAAILLGYVLFSTGSIATMTFMIAWLRDAGAGGVAQSAFWSLLGLGGIASPFLWSWALARLRGGRAVAAFSAIVCLATIVALAAGLRAGELASAFVFGSAFFAVVAATTAFVRRNFAPPAWPSGVGAMTVAFALGQAIGPLLAGAVIDTTGSLLLSLQVSIAVMAAGAAVAMLQRDLV